MRRVTPKQEMGNLPCQHKRHNLKDHNIYCMLSDSNSPLSIAKLQTPRCESRIQHLIAYLDRITSDLPKPDLLHTIQIEMLKLLLTWVDQFLKQHKRLDKFNNIWLSVPAYLDTTKPRQRQDIGILLAMQENQDDDPIPLWGGVICNALRDPSPLSVVFSTTRLERSHSLIQFYFLLPRVILMHLLKRWGPYGQCSTPLP